MFLGLARNRVMFAVTSMFITVMVKGQVMRCNVLVVGDANSFSVQSHLIISQRFVGERMEINEAGDLVTVVVMVHGSWCWLRSRSRSREYGVVFWPSSEALLLSFHLTHSD